MSTEETIDPVSDKPITKKIKLKRKHYYDEYILTNKHIICKFKYLVVAYDRQVDSRGLISWSTEELQKHINAQNVELSSNRINGYFWRVCNELKKWHPQISKVEVDFKNILDLGPLHNYDWDHIGHSLCQEDCPVPGFLSDEDLSEFETLNHQVVDLKVYFKLVKKIEHIEDYNTNFYYLHKLVTTHMASWNKTEKCDLGAQEVASETLPFASDLGFELEPKTLTSVVPSLKLFPLSPVITMPRTIKSSA